jgi:hypothetical protein
MGIEFLASRLKGELPVDADTLLVPLSDQRQHFML